MTPGEAGCPGHQVVDPAAAHASAVGPRVSMACRWSREGRGAAGGGGRQSGRPATRNAPGANSLSGRPCAGGASAVYMQAELMQIVFFLHVVQSKATAAVHWTRGSQLPRVPTQHEFA